MSPPPSPAGGGGGCSCESPCEGVVCDCGLTSCSAMNATECVPCGGMGQLACSACMHLGISFCFFCIFFQIIVNFISLFYSFLRFYLLLSFGSYLFLPLPQVTMAQYPLPAPLPSLCVTSARGQTSAWSLAAVCVRRMRTAAVACVAVACASVGGGTSLSRMMTVAVIYSER